MGEAMHPVAVKCIKWAVGLFLVGALTSTYGADAMVRLSDYAGANATVGLTILNVVLTIMIWAMMPLAGSLVGAAVVIQTLAPYVRAIDDEDEDEDEEGIELDTLTQPHSIEG